MTRALFTAQYADCIFNEDHFLTLGGEFQNNSEWQKINWDDKFMISSDPHTQETEFQIQKIINLHNATNNLPDALIDYNGVMKTWNPTVNAPKQVEVLMKTTLTSSTKKRGMTETTRKDTTSEKRSRKEKSKAPKKIQECGSTRC
jgi:hypothetical protein